MTYGDGLSDININVLVESHKKSDRLITMSAVQPAGRFGALEFDGNDQITAFKEKPQGEVGWINGGFFAVRQPQVFDFIVDGDKTIFERAPLEQLASMGQMNCYKHYGFWKLWIHLRIKIASPKCGSVRKQSGRHGNKISIFRCI